MRTAEPPRKFTVAHEQRVLNSPYAPLWREWEESWNVKGLINL
jgi:hypothetical protein